MASVRFYKSTATESADEVDYVRGIFWRMKWTDLPKFNYIIVTNNECPADWGNRTLRNIRIFDLEQKSCIGYYIPFAKSLHKLIKIIPHNETLTYASNSDNLKTDIFDGEYIKEKLSLKANKNQLIFLIYCDDIELVNPIGAHRSKHKISK